MKKSILNTKGEVNICEESFWIYQGWIIFCTNLAAFCEENDWTCGQEETCPCHLPWLQEKVSSMVCLEGASQQVCLETCKSWSTAVVILEPPCFTEGTRRRWWNACSCTMTSGWGGIKRQSVFLSMQLPCRKNWTDWRNRSLLTSWTSSRAHAFETENSLQENWL